MVILESRIARAKLIVRDVVVNVVVMAVLHILFIGETGISGNYNIYAEDVVGITQAFEALLNTIEHWKECLLSAPSRSGPAP